VHAASAPPSSRHWNVAPVSDENAKLAAEEFVVAGGPPEMTVPAPGASSIWVTGAVVSIVHVKLAGVGSVFPAASVARTAKVWLPWLSDA
jgi:hypothetical protein